MNPLEHAIYKLRNAPILHYPFPHFFVENVFPEGFFDTLRSSLDKLTYEPLAGGYKARVATSEMPACMEPFSGDEGMHRFTRAIMALFVKQFYERFPSTGRPEFRSEWRFIRDSQGYSIGPHTDAPQKVVSLLFYIQADHPGPFPESYDLEDYWHDYTQYGTGIYVPEDGVKTCIGGPHHKFDGFREAWRAPFFVNSCFGFWKTANSWHGVSPIPAKIRRDVLLFNIYQEN